MPQPRRESGADLPLTSLPEPLSPGRKGTRGKEKARGSHPSHLPHADEEMKPTTWELGARSRLRVGCPALSSEPVRTYEKGSGEKQDTSGGSVSQTLPFFCLLSSGLRLRLPSLPPRVCRHFSKLRVLLPSHNPSSQNTTFQTLHREPISLFLETFPDAVTSAATPKTPGTPEKRLPLSLEGGVSVTSSLHLPS